jgi:hypothetical protein
VLLQLLLVLSSLGDVSSGGEYLPSPRLVKSEKENVTLLNTHIYTYTHIHIYILTLHKTHISIHNCPLQNSVRHKKQSFRLPRQYSF